MDGAYVVHLLRVTPDLQKFLRADVSGGPRELHARVDIPVGRDVTERVAGAARQSVQIAVIHRPGRRAELLHVPYQVSIPKDLL
jgi:hypothetical protein